MSKSTTKTYKHSVWSSFARYIKIRDANKDGYCNCCTCGKLMWWEDRDCNAGHFIGGRKNAVLFDETIVHAQCGVKCNKYGGGMPWDYEQFMMKKYGYTYAQLEDIKLKRNQEKQYKLYELKELKQYFDAEFERIRKEKGL